MRCLIVLCLMCSSAMAGPWMRAPGDQFLSLSAELTKASSRPEVYMATYYELGLSPRLTMGIDAGRDSWGQSGTLVFARLPLPSAGQNSVMSTELAMGTFTGATGSQFALRTGLSWGRSVQARQGGWLSVEATYSLMPETGFGLGKIEGTVGMYHGEKATYILQLTTEKATGRAPLLSVTPGLTWRLGQKTQLLGGLILRSDGTASLKVGFWFEP